VANSDIDYIELHLAMTTLSYTQMVKRYGPNWKNWPQSTEWYKALARLETLRVVTPPPTLKVTITGTAKEGQTLTAVVS
jgi:hypothetical protein